MKEHHPNKNQRGIALVQVLLMVGVISILLLIMMQYTRQQLEQVSDVQEQLDNRMQLYTGATELQYALLTNDWLAAGDVGYSAGSNSWQQNWNFYGHEFQVGPYTARITNLGSLINLQGDGSNLRDLMTQVGIPAARARQLANIAANAQPQPDRGTLLLSDDPGMQNKTVIQHPRELVALNNWELQDVLLIEPFVTTHSQQLLNPLLVPDMLLPLVVTGEQSDILRNMRREGNFNRIHFTRVTGQGESEFVSFYPGPGFRLEIRMTGQDYGSVRRIDGIFRPYQYNPISVRRIEEHH